MTSIYKLDLNPTKATLYFLYKGEVLQQLFLECGPNGESLKFMDMAIPYRKEQLPPGTIELKPRTVQDKVVAFCMAYRSHFNVPYNPGKTEKANMKNVQVTRELLNTYFNTTDYPLTVGKSMADYVRHFNFIRQITANGKPVKSEFPAVYDREYEKKISEDASKLQRYWKHLRDNGWKKIDGVWQPS